MKLFKDQRGSTFLEIMLWMALFVLAIAPVIAGIASATSGKFNLMKNRIEQVGTP